jgi:hypothetical protein
MYNSNLILKGIIFLSLNLTCSICFSQNQLFWSRSGNSATASDFIGTNNLSNLNFRTNGVQRLTITSTGAIGIGTSSPLADK